MFSRLRFQSSKNNSSRPPQYSSLVTAPEACSKAPDKAVEALTRATQYTNHWLDDKGSEVHFRGIDIIFGFNLETPELLLHQVVGLVFLIKMSVTTDQKKTALSLY